MTETAVASSDLVGWRRGVDRAFIYLVTLFFVGVLLQVFFAGVGAFGELGDHVTKLEDASSFDPHRALRHILGALALLLRIPAALARAAPSVWVGALVIAVLEPVAQSGLAPGGVDNKW